MKIERTTLFTKELTCVLELKDIQARGQELAHAERKLRELEEEKKEKVKGYNDRIKAQKKSVANLTDATLNGQESRDVECQVERKLDTGKAVTTRLDTKEEIDQRDLTDEEREGLAQLSLLERKQTEAEAKAAKLKNKVQ